MSTLSARAKRVHRVLQETGARPMSIVTGLCGTDTETQRVVGELFIAGVVKWVSAKRHRRLAATTRKDQQ